MGRGGGLSLPRSVSEGREGTATMKGIPEGFKLLGRTSPLVNLLGPFYARGEGGNLVLGLREAEKHTNARGFARGGVLFTLADVALGYAAEGSVDPSARLKEGQRNRRVRSVISERLFGGQTSLGDENGQRGGR